MLTFLIISFIGYILFLSLSRSIDVLETPFVICCLAITLLYLFGIFGHLQAGLIIFITSGVLLGIYAFTKTPLIKQRLSSLRANGIESFFYPAFAIPFLISYYLISNDYLFTGWDEFSFWATSTKVIYESNSLWGQNTPIGFKHYPPAQQLFQYLFLSVAGWSEKTVLYAHTFLTLSALLYSASALIKSNLTRLFVFCSFCIFIYIINYTFSNIYSDPLLGAVFASALISTIKFDCRLPKFLLTILFTTVLILVKEIGLILAFVVFFTFISINIWSATTDKLNKISYSIGFLFFIFAVFESWQIYLHHIGSHKAINPISLSDYFLNYDLERLNLTLAEFYRRLLKPGYLLFDNSLEWGIYFSVLSTSCYLTSLSVFICLANKNSALIKNLITLFTALFLGFLVYLVFLLFSYLVFFSDYEGVRLASFERYISSYMLAWIIITLALLFRTIELHGKWIAIALSSLLLYLLLYSSPYYFKQDYRGIKTDIKFLPTRNQLQSRLNELKPYLKQSDRVYFIHQNSTGFEMYMFYYLASPIVMANSCWSIGPKYYPGDVWTCNQNLSELSKNYNYLVINQADEQFWTANAPLFEKPQTGKLTEGIYKRIVKPNGSSYFQRID